MGNTAVNLRLEGVGSLETREEAQVQISLHHTLSDSDSAPASALKSPSTSQQCTYLNNMKLYLHNEQTSKSFWLQQDVL